MYTEGVPKVQGHNDLNAHLWRCCLAEGDRTNGSAGKAVITYATEANNLIRIYDVSQATIDAAWLDIRAGYNGGAWDGYGIGTTTISEADYGLGLVLQADVNSATYLGIRKMLIGDVNGDDVVNAADGNIILAHLDTLGTWLTGDINYDGRVDMADYALVREPATLSLLALGGLALLRRRAARGKRR